MRLAPTIAVALSAAALAAPAVAAGAGEQQGSPDARSVARGAAYLERAAIRAPGGQQADAITALAAAGRTRAALRDDLARLARVAPGYATTAGAAGKVAIAVSAAGGNARRFAGTDFVARIQRSYAAGRYGATGLDQAYAMIGLAAAGERVPTAAVNAVRAARGQGGWNYGLRSSSADDVTTTGLVIEAMRAAGVPARDPALRAAATWMLAQRNADGGFAYSGDRAESNSTAIAIRALIALGRTPPAATRAALRGLQTGTGGFDFRRGDGGSQLLGTTDAVPALAGQALPVRPAR